MCAWLCVLCVMQYINEVKLKAAFIYLATGYFSQAETLLHESGCDPREVSDTLEQVTLSSVLH